MKHGRVIFFGSLLIPMLIGLVLYMVWSDKTGASFLEAVSVVPVLLVLLQDFVKIFVTASKQDQIRELVVKIGEVWPRNIQNEAKRDEIKSWTRRLKTFDDAYFTCGIVTEIFYLGFPLGLTIYSFVTDPNNAKYEMPMQLYFFCWLDSHYQYALAFMYFVVTCAVNHICIYISTDFLLVALTYDISALFSVLQIDLKNITTHSSRQRRNSARDDDEIKHIAATHQKLLAFVKTLDDIFSPSIFVQVTFSSIIICCFGFLAVVDKEMLVRGAIVVLGELFAIFILAWPGQIIVDTSYEVSTAAYFCPWYKKSAKFGKQIALIIARAQQPSYLSVYGFSVLTLPMFSKVCSTSWSYLSLLMQMYQDSQA